MLYDTPRSINPLVGPRTFGRHQLFFPRRRGLGLSVIGWSLQPATRTDPDKLVSPGGLSVPLSSLGIDKTWQLDGIQSNPSIVTLLGVDGTRKTFTFQIVGAGIAHSAGTLSLVSTQTQKQPMPLPSGYTSLGTTDKMQAFLIQITGVTNSNIVPPHPAGDVWAYKYDVTFADPHVDHIGKRYTILDLSTGETYTTDVNEASGGGYNALVIGGSVGKFLTESSAAIIRGVSDLSTGGITEAIGLVSDKAQQDIDNVVGGSQVGGAAGAATGFVSSGFNPYGAIAGAVAGSVTGTVQGVKADIAGRDVNVGDVLVGGAISGTAAGLTTAASAASAAATTPVESAPFDFTPAGLSPVSSIDTAGSTLLPPSLSLIPTQSTLPSIFASIPTVGPLATTPGYTLPPDGATIQTAGQTLLPNNLSLVQVPAPPSVVLAGPVAPIDFSSPPIEHLDIPPSPQDTAGSTLLPSNLSLVPSPPTSSFFGLPAPVPVPVGGDSVLTDIYNAGKVAVPGAISGYQLYKKLTTPTSAGTTPTNNTLVLGATGSATPASSYGLPLLAGGALLLLLGAKAHH